MGCSASSDEWCKRSDAALSGIPGVHKLVDDILIEAKDYDQLFEGIETVLQRCVDSNITISLKKMQVGESVVFAGYKISNKSTVWTGNDVLFWCLLHVQQTPFPS